MTKQKPKYLFVDIDGCMTSISDGNHYICKNNETYGKCPRTIKLLKKIASETKCKIIISSNWRKFDDDGFYTFDGMKCANPLPEIRKQLGKLCVGDLPHDRHINKSEALQLWFEDVGIRYTDVNFAIIDDDLTEGFYSNPNFKQNYFMCNYHNGLTDDIANTIIKHLNGNLVFSYRLFLTSPRENKLISSSESYTDIENAMHDFLNNPENIKKYKIEDYQTVHSWIDGTEKGTKEKIIDFGDYSHFLKIIRKEV